MGRLKELTWRSNELQAKREAVMGLELEQEWGGAVINLSGWYRVGLGVCGCVPGGCQREPCMLIKFRGAVTSENELCTGKCRTRPNLHI